jgi:chromosome segregation ATPase
MGRNVSLDFSGPLKLLKQPLHDSIDELREGYRSLSECVEQAVSECEQRGTELADCRSQLAEARRSLLELEKVLSERTNAEADATRRSTEQKQQLDSVQAELAESTNKIQASQAEEFQCRQRLEVQIERNQQLQSQIERLQDDETESRNELTQLRAQFGPLTEATVEAARVRGELATVEGQLAELRDQPDMREQLAIAITERKQAESELDQLRHRSAELSEALAEQKRLVSEEREQWSDELRLLRRAVDRQAELMVHQPGPAAAAGPAVHASAGEPAPTVAAKNDQVMDSVIKQFEMLQKTKVRKMVKSAG